MASPISMLTEIAYRDVTEQECLTAVANSQQSVEFFELTNIGCFPAIDFYGQYPMKRAQSEIDAVLASYGIAYSQWEVSDMEAEPYDYPGERRVRRSNGVVHFDVHIPARRG